MVLISSPPSKLQIRHTDCAALPLESCFSIRVELKSKNPKALSGEKRASIMGVLFDEMEFSGFKSCLFDCLAGAKGTGVL